MGLSFHFRSIKSMVKNRKSAARLRDKKSGSDVLPPYNANSIMVNAAEMIRPDEADFRPFSISGT